MKLQITFRKQSERNTYCKIKKSLKIPKGQSESVYRRRTDNTMAKIKKRCHQTPFPDHSDSDSDNTFSENTIIETKNIIPIALHS